jgi:hypothetical protein
MNRNLNPAEFEGVVGGMEFDQSVDTLNSASFDDLDAMVDSPPAGFSSGWVDPGTLPDRRR